MPVFKSGAFDFCPCLHKWQTSLLQMFLKTNPSEINLKPIQKAKLNTTVLNRKIDQANRKLGGKDTDINGCNKPLVTAQNKSPQFMCALKKAQAAYNDGKASGKVKKDIFIINDFSTGGVTGKMWFVNANGTPANITDKNPIRCF